MRYVSVRYLCVCRFNSWRAINGFTVKWDYLLVGPSQFLLTFLENGGQEQIRCAGPWEAKCKWIYFWLLSVLTVFLHGGDSGSNFVIRLKGLTLQWVDFLYNGDPFCLWRDHWSGGMCQVLWPVFPNPHLDTCHVPVCAECTKRSFGLVIETFPVSLEHPDYAKEDKWRAMALALPLKQDAGHLLVPCHPSPGSQGCCRAWAHCSSASWVFCHVTITCLGAALQAGCSPVLLGWDQNVLRCCHSCCLM